LSAVSLCVFVRRFTGFSPWPRQDAWVQSHYRADENTFGGRYYTKGRWSPFAGSDAAQAARHEKTLDAT
jgi:hypothetical protein